MTDNRGKSGAKSVVSLKIFEMEEFYVSRIPRQASKSHGSRRSANFCAIAYCETLSISALSNCNSSQLESTKLRARRCTARIMRRRQTLGEPNRIPLLLLQPRLLAFVAGEGVRERTDTRSISSIRESVYGLLSNAVRTSPHPYLFRFFSPLLFFFFFLCSS